MKPAEPDPYSHGDVHIEMRKAVRHTAGLLLAYPETHPSGGDIEAVTDALLEVLAATWQLGFREGQEECCGMGSYPNPYIKETH